MKLLPVPPPPGFRDTIASSYDAVAAKREEMGEAEWRWPLAEQFLEMMRQRDLTSLLEIGAGVGFTSRWFVDRDIAVTATDLSPQQVELCRAKGLDAHVADMYHLDFPAESFGAVWMMNCIHHVPAADTVDVLTGIARVIQPDGLVYLGVWGGVDDEGIPEDDFYQPARFFCFRSDTKLRAAVEQVFDVVSFDTFTPEEDADGLHMQSLILQRRP